jgi:hypothetical protein
MSPAHFDQISDTQYRLSSTCLYLQLNNAPDNKSKVFLAFISYLIEKKVFQKIKLSYLIVGHTHEDVDSFFTVISRYFKFTLKRVHTVEAFETALFSCFKQAPVCVEQLKFCFDYSGLVQFVDAKLARFNLHEKMRNKCHYFLFWYDSAEGCFFFKLMICTLFLFEIACLLLIYAFPGLRGLIFCKG